MPEPATYGPLGERTQRPPARRTLVLPIVTEIVPVLEPVGRDPFIAGPDEPVRCRSWQPHALTRRARPRG